MAALKSKSNDLGCYGTELTKANIWGRNGQQRLSR
jgi:hypothetical protein